MDGKTCALLFAFVMPFEAFTTVIQLIEIELLDCLFDMMWNGLNHVWFILNTEVDVRWGFLLKVALDKFAEWILQVSCVCVKIHS